MPPRRPIQALLFPLAMRLIVMALCAMCAEAFAQADPPGRVARLNHIEGAVSFAPAGDNEFVDAELNRPLVRGDRLWTDKGSRAEIQAGSAAMRMDGQTQLQLMAMDDPSTQVSVTQGSLYVRVRSLPEGENFEIDTPQLAWRAAYPGDYRIDVDPSSGTTRVTVHSGTGAVYGEKGQSLAMGGGQQITFRGRGLTQVNTQESPPQDNFDRWAAERNRREDQSVAARYLPREVVGYQQLDTAGQWTQDPTLGAVWFPQSTPANWAPFRNGRWKWISPWGWTWIDDAPWGFVTSHYGRWTTIQNRWGWVPGRMGLRPMFAPALVAFLGGGAANRQSVAWFPLAPGEAWQPGYKATPLYISTINSNMPPQPNGHYAHGRRPEAVTAMSTEDFNRGKPTRGSSPAIAANLMAQAQVVPPPAMPDRAVRTAASKAPAGSAALQPVANNPAALQQQAQRDKQAQERMAREQAAKAEQAKAEQARAEQIKAEQARAEQAKAERAKAEQAKVEEAKAEAEKAQQAKLEHAKAEQLKAEQARVAQQARLAEQAKAEQAKAEQAKAAQLKAEQAKAAAQALAAEQARASEQARRAEQLRLAEQMREAERRKVADQARAAETARALQASRAAAQARADSARAAQQTRAAEQARDAAARQQEQLQARRTEQARRETLARKADQARREQTARREQVRQEQVAEARAKREQAAAARAQAQRELQARKVEQARRAAAERKDDESRKIAHAQQVEAARRAAEHEAQALRDQREQRQKRDEAARRQSDEREQQAQRDAWQRQQQALSEQWRRDQQSWDLQQRERARQRPDLRNDTRTPPSESEFWRRGIPILNPGRAS